ncbi:3-isopropylmalate dehydrogenase [hydrothermal vent metagenome]|uniref:3-isopropylmalate dehydrogenase n=1 Tax=hydrothermal vent metagenome TaxID=652676 RepID=A0A3B0V8P2_9ZZZZ
MKKYNILALPGDGIGPEIVNEALRVLGNVAGRFNVEFSVNAALVGGASIDQSGMPLIPEVLQAAIDADAVLLGAVGGPKWEAMDYSIRPERALLALRKELGLFVNLRPARVYGPLIDSSTLKREVIEGVDIMVLRELTGGIYFGEPRGVQNLPDGTQKGVNTYVYTTPEIERIAHAAFEVAMKRSKRLTSIDKANVLETTELWRKVVIEVGRNYPEVELSHMYVDNCAMQLVRNPGQFDVLVTGNMFGDIISDEAAMLTGSIGMLPSASLGEGGKHAMYEPIHGSAPDIAGQGIANPLATILSVVMMLRYSFEMEEAASWLESAVDDVLDKGYRTPDIFTEGMRKVSCTEMGDAVLAELEALVS